MSTRFLLVVFLLAAPTFALKVGEQIESDADDYVTTVDDVQPVPIAREDQDPIVDDESDIMERRKASEEAQKNPPAVTEFEEEELSGFVEETVGVEISNEALDIHEERSAHGMGIGDFEEEEPINPALVEAEEKGADDEVMMMAPQRKRASAAREAMVEEEGMKAYEDEAKRQEDMRDSVARQEAERRERSVNEEGVDADESRDDDDSEPVKSEEEEEEDSKLTDADYETPRFGSDEEEDGSADIEGGTEGTDRAFEVL